MYIIFSYFLYSYCLCVPVETRRGCQIPWDSPEIDILSYGVSGNQSKPKSSARAEKAHNCWAIRPAPHSSSSKVYEISLLLTPNLNEIIQWLSFCAWLTSLNMMPPGFNPVTVMTNFIFLRPRGIPSCICNHFLFLSHISINGHLGCFHFLAIMSKCWKKWESRGLFDFHFHWVHIHPVLGLLLFLIFKGPFILIFLLNSGCSGFYFYREQELLPHPIFANTCYLLFSKYFCDTRARHSLDAESPARNKMDKNPCLEAEGAIQHRNSCLLCCGSSLQFQALNTNSICLSTVVRRGGGEHVGKASA